MGTALPSTTDPAEVTARQLQATAGDSGSTSTLHTLGQCHSSSAPLFPAPAPVSHSSHQNDSATLTTQGTSLWKMLPLRSRRGRAPFPSRLHLPPVQEQPGMAPGTSRTAFRYSYLDPRAVPCSSLTRLPTVHLLEQQRLGK